MFKENRNGGENPAQKWFWNSVVFENLDTCVNSVYLKKQSYLQEFSLSYWYITRFSCVHSLKTPVANHDPLCAEKSQRKEIQSYDDF